MSLKLVPPSGEERREQLKRELEREKARFDEASQRAVEVIKRDFSITRWFQDYPLESALFAVASAVILAKAIRGERPLPPPPLRSI